MTTEEIIAAVNAAGFQSAEELTEMLSVSRLIIDQRKLQLQQAALRAQQASANADAEAQYQALQQQIDQIQQTLQG